ncbi:MAG: anthranilate phosphoribosyltransferase [Isosphaeraceae bacterium]|nr:anthranilate phosphoribosyltransferase [Isosphaeraceae bacterium]
MMSPLIEALAILGTGRDLSAEQAGAAVGAIMAGTESEAATAAFLAVLRVKGETAEELAGAVRAVRDRMTVLEDPLPATLDTCGTGGDGARTVNVSTATAILAAACGVPVAKHGNRSSSGNSGSAEVLAELGVAAEAEPPVVRRCLIELGITFLFAPRFHPALRFAAPARRQLPFRTLFNLVGPLANPARPAYQLVGVPNEAQAELLAHALAGLGLRRAAVVTGGDGLDEVTLGGPTRVRLIERGEVRLETWEPPDFGLPDAPSDALRVAGPAESARCLRRLLDGEKGPVRNVVLANTAAALRVADRVGSLREGVALAAEALDSGAAARLLDRWIELSRSAP